MNAAVGTLGVALALLSCVCGIGALAYGLITHRLVAIGAGFRFAPLVGVGALVATLAMQRALITHDFSLAYVERNSARTTPALYVVSGMWASLEGSILLWGLVLAGFVVLVWRRGLRHQNDPLASWALLTMLGVAAFFFALMLGPANPFRTLANVPLDGRGPNPLLQNHPLMAFHPPILYVGYVGFTVPFAYAIAALVTGRLGEGWLLATRRWTLLAWGCLTVGIVLGAWWSYEVLGWGGFWGWDPVENVSLLPWLTGTAYLHSVLVQERRGMLRVWNLSLVLATFSLTILGTFLTRSGVLASVHAFSNSSIGRWLLTFFGVCVTVTLGLIFWRGDLLRSPSSIDSPKSREASFLANNVLFGTFAFVVLLGTVFPLLVEAVNGDQLTVGAPYFDRLAVPLGLTLLFLMGVAPVLPWRRASNEVLAQRLLWPTVAGVGTVVVAAIAGVGDLGVLGVLGLGAFAAGSAVRQLVLAGRAAKRSGRSVLAGLVGRANGGMIVHLGVIVIAVAIGVSHAYGKSTELKLKPNECARFEGHEICYRGLDLEKRPDRTRLVANLQTDGGRVDRPAITQFNSRGQEVGTPSVRTGLAGDLYFTFIQKPRTGGDRAVFGVYLQPMIIWLWIGALMMAIGTVLSAFPGRRRRPTEPSSVWESPASAHGPADHTSESAVGADRRSPLLDAHLPEESTDTQPVEETV